MTAKLIVLLGGNHIGQVVQDQGRLKFAYEEKWRQSPRAYPLSISMPLTAAEHGHNTISAFVWGLLPDNEFILARWAKRFQVSARNPFALIGAVGEDCAGAVQFVRPERVDDVLGSNPGEVDWLSEADVAARLSELHKDRAAWRIAHDTGQFSLAGAQPKTALLYENGKWGVPSGRIPTTHILKPPMADVAGHAENEHICLQLGAALGLPTAHSKVMRFKGELAIVIERYDRERTKSDLIRIHQEDMCQATAILPTLKYENDGGPGVQRIADILRNSSDAADEDVGRFVDALIFNWLIAGTDAHAKNYSMLIGEAGIVRLAPFYDIASILPHDFDAQKIRSAMRIGDEYRLRDIGRRQWIKLAKDVRLDEAKLMARISELIAALPDNLSDVCRETGAAGMTDPIVARLQKEILERVKSCEKLF